MLICLLLHSSRCFASTSEGEIVMSWTWTIMYVVRMLAQELGLFRIWSLRRTEICNGLECVCDRDG